MESLRTYLNSLEPADQTAYAIRCGTSIGYLRKALSKRHKIDAGSVRLLWDHSHGKVSRHELRPDVWTRPEDDRWPESVPNTKAA
jgi:DNA-binding transcriptional regulator YdaS (Cro superfamily)